MASYEVCERAKYRINLSEVCKKKIQNPMVFYTYQKTAMTLGKIDGAIGLYTWAGVVL